MLSPEVMAHAAAKIQARLVHARVSQLVPDHCWLWQGAKTSTTATAEGYVKRGGYGVIKLRRLTGSLSPRYVHRIMWEHEHGPVPAGHELDHLCEVAHCVRPSHLEPVAHAENIRRHYERRAAA